MTSENYPVELIEEDDTWVCWRNIDMSGKGDIQQVRGWKEKHTLQELKQICSTNGWSGFTISDGVPSFDFVAFKTFNYQLTNDHCKPISKSGRPHPCRIYINKKSEWKGVIPEDEIGELIYEDNNWEAYKNVDMFAQGDVHRINDWKTNHTIEELKEIVIKYNYSSVTVSAGKPDFGHAAFKKFPFKLTKDKCKPVTESDERPCIIYIHKRQNWNEQIEQASRINFIQDDADAVIIQEVWNESFQGVQAALDSGAYVETVGGKENGTGLNAAAKLGNVEIIKLLIKHGANIHRTNGSGYSPLHQAVFHNHLEVAKMLLDIGADHTSTIQLHCPIGAGKLPFEWVGAAVTHQTPNQELIGLLKKDFETMEQAYHADGPRIVLVLRDSPRACIFEHTKDWLENPEQSFPMTLSNYPDHGLVCKQAKHSHYGPWAVKRVGVGPKDKAMHVHIDKKWLTRTCDGNWLDVDCWSYREENGINMLYNTDGDRPTPGGQDFVVNSDGTISPSQASWLCLGLEQPTLVLVPNNSPHALHFSNYASEGLFPLTLAGAFANLGIINLHEGTKTAGEWKYTQTAIGSAEDAVLARRQENFIRREDDGLALDVSHWKYEVGNSVNWVGGQTEDRTLLYGGGRDFYPDPRAEKGLPYNLICGGAPHLVLGASTDLRLYSHLTSEGSYMQVKIVTGLYSKVLNVNKNMTLKDLKSQVKEEMTPGEEVEFKIVLNQESKTN